MRKRFGVTACIACAALVVGISAAAPPAGADSRDRQQEPSYGEQHSRTKRDTKERRDYRTPPRRRVYVRPRLIRRFEPIRRHYVLFPAWSRDARAVYWNDRPYFFHASMGVFVSGGSIFVSIGNVPPAGYAYFDPYCGRVFRTIADYRRHCAFEHHPPLVRLIATGRHDSGWIEAYGGYEDLPLPFSVQFGD
jgi:hypothetical protein